jgi:hypothetical protein
MKRIFCATLACALGMGTAAIALAQDTDAKQDVKDAAHSTKKAVKKTARKTKKVSKKVVNKASGEVEEGADKVRRKTEQ